MHAHMPHILFNILSYHPSYNSKVQKSWMALELDFVAYPQNRPISRPHMATISYYNHTVCTGMRPRLHGLSENWDIGFTFHLGHLGLRRASLVTRRAIIDRSPRLICTSSASFPLIIRISLSNFACSRRKVRSFFFQGLTRRLHCMLIGGSNPLKNPGPIFAPRVVSFSGTM